ncbi:uncharacterized protein LOC117111232 [Anneissia japonica]|uniref:uncharacterized protein LOC117111232 n=1 Tax=Anneissia japonica TaxID=1529436 RepID=UPI001425532C|nr:uncharacterized protein LOC117111232 [Anneissia japonica]XP_033110026.1 uncharacterized protein LOC117111232 [Anneissia japonica]XP_033110027.1 uncharacterized protein LOC117111232 [Anneissia japonica]
MDDNKCSFRATPLPSAQEDNTQEDDSEERDVINKLLQCSEIEDQLLQIIHCQEWTEAVNGWKPTIPNPTYATHTCTPQQEVNANKRHDRESKKEKQTHKKSLYQESLWRSKIEPGTYRYNPNHTWQFQGSNSKHYTNIKKRPTDPQLIEHIERVREHLEKTLIKKDSELPVYEGTKASQNQFTTNSIHNFISHLSEHNKKNFEKTPLRLSQSLTDLKNCNLVDKPSLSQSPQKVNQKLLRETEPWPPSSYNVVNAGGDSPQIETPQLPFVTVVSKKPNSHSYIITTEGDREQHEVSLLAENPSNGICHDDKNNNVRRLKNLERHSSAGKLQSSKLASRSFEKFPAQTLFHQDQHLNPLTKLTPSLRKVSDDNEVIMVHLNGSRCDASPSSAPASVTTHGRNRTPVEKDSLQHYYLKVDAPNKNFIRTGISGKSVSPANQRKLNGKSSKLAPKATSIKQQAKKTFGPTNHRLASLGRPTEYATNPLDTLHRGAFERDTATAIASEILPGISGRKVGVPVLSHRIL